MGVERGREMLDIGWTELGVVVVILLLFVGPSDLPKVVKGFREMMSHVRRVRSEFQGHLDEMVRESDVKDMLLSEGREVEEVVKGGVDSLKEKWEGEVEDLQSGVEGSSGGVKDIAQEIKAGWEDAMSSVPEGRSGEEVKKEGGEDGRQDGRK